MLQILIYRDTRHGKSEACERFFRRIFQKATANPTRVALVAARTWRNSSFGAFLLLAFLLRLLRQKKSGKRFIICLWRERGTPTCVFPSFKSSQAFEIHPSWRFGRIRGISPVATGDRRSRRLRQAFEKA
jgi:hypothetical protein